MGNWSDSGCTLKGKPRDSKTIKYRWERKGGTGKEVRSFILSSQKDETVPPTEIIWVVVAHVKMSILQSMHGGPASTQEAKAGRLPQVGEQSR